MTAGDPRPPYRGTGLRTGAASGSADNVAGGLTWPAANLRIRRVSLEAPWHWLSAGWHDLVSVPAISLTYGGVFAAVAVALLYALSGIGLGALVLALAGGFLLVGPMFGVGLYEASRRLENRLAIDPRDVAMVGVRSPGQLAQMGLLLLLIYFVWVLLGLLLLMLFMGTRPMPPLHEFIANLLLTSNGLGLLLAGTATGAVLAMLVFAVAAVSVPLLMVRDIDVVTAAAASVAATRTNLLPMVLWAMLIAATTALGFATLGAGLIVTFPLIGHATWHAFRDLIELDPEPEIVPDVVTG